MAEAGRTKKSLINSVLGLLSYLIITVLTFFSQRVFVNILGYEILGLNTLFNTIIATLSIAEIGIGTAICFSLYKPLVERDERKIAAIIALFRRIYLVIGVIIIIIGLAIIPLLPILSKHEYTLAYLMPAYFIFLANTLISYIFTYNHTLISADQKNYINALVNAFTKIFIVCIQIAVLYIWNNFYIFLTVMLVLNATSNILLSLFVVKKYSYIKKYKKEKLDEESIKGIKTNVFALLYHRIGNYLVTGTDTLIISGFLGTLIVGYYASYVTVMNAIAALVASVFSGLMAGFGNLIVNSEKEYTRKVFRRAQFANYVFFAIVLAGFFALANQFMALWLTSETILPLETVIVICFNFFITGYSRPLGDIRAAAGVFKPDQYLHIIIAVVNLIISLVLVNFIGLTGVLLGTSICLIIKECIVLPMLGSKYIYGGKTKDYYLRLVLELVLAIGITALCWFINGYIVTGSAIIDFVLGGLICVFVPIIIICLLYFKTEELNYFLNLIKNIVGKTAKTKNITDKVEVEEGNENNTDGA